jgi:hypothetical protein
MQKVMQAASMCNNAMLPRSWELHKRGRNCWKRQGSMNTKTQRKDKDEPKELHCYKSLMDNDYNGLELNKRSNKEVKKEGCRAKEEGKGGS